MTLPSRPCSLAVADELVDLGRGAVVDGDHVALLGDIQREVASPSRRARSGRYRQSPSDSPPRQLGFSLRDLLACGATALPTPGAASGKPAEAAYLSAELRLGCRPVSWEISFGHAFAVLARRQAGAGYRLEPRHRLCHRRRRLPAPAPTSSSTPATRWPWARPPTSSPQSGVRVRGRRVRRHQRGQRQRRGRAHREPRSGRSTSSSTMPACSTARRSTSFRPKSSTRSCRPT